MAILPVCGKWSHGTSQNDRDRQFYVAASPLGLLSPGRGSRRLPGSEPSTNTPSLDSFACCCGTYRRTPRRRRLLFRVRPRNAAREPVPLLTRLVPTPRIASPIIVTSTASTKPEVLTRLPTPLTKRTCQSAAELWNLLRPVGADERHLPRRSHRLSGIRATLMKHHKSPAWQRISQ
jgi:hypothetical protein